MHDDSPREDHAVVEQNDIFVLLLLPALYLPITETAPR